MKAKSKIIGGLVLAGMLATAGTGLAAAVQDAFTGITLEPAAPVRGEPISMNATDVSSLRKLSDVQLETFLNALDATPQLSFDALPRKGMCGTFYSLQHPNWPPLPGNVIQVPVWQMSDFYLLNDVDYDYEAASAVSLAAGPRMRPMSMSLSGPPGFGDGGGTNSYAPDGLTYNVPDYGTNLWIAQMNLTNGYLAGIGTNTQADIQYEIQSRTNLLQSDWQSEGFILGSELTNWTPLSVAQGSRSNLFIRLKSWADSTGNGLPDWWQWQYFGTNGVDPYGNPAGDGWNNLQKFQAGMNPNQFYTPPAPQNFTVSLDGKSRTATMNWSPSPGPVTSYTVSRDYYPPFMGDVVSQTFNVSAGTTSIHDPQTLLPYDNIAPTIYAYYSIQANYSGGTSASAEQWLEPFSFQQMPSISVIPAMDGSVLLAVAKLAPGTAGLRLTRSDLYAENHGDSSYDTSFFIPLSSITNGLFPVPAAWLAPVADGYGGAYYEWYVQAVNAAGGATSPGESLDIQSAVMPFYDGRAQLKQNLIFQLRVASQNDALQFSVASTNYFYPFAYSSQDEHGLNWFDGNYAAPGNYAFASYYTSDQNYPNPGLIFDEFSPFKDNYRYANFACNSTRLNSLGLLDTGFDYYGMDLSNPTFQFQGQTNNASIAPLLDTNATRWLYTFYRFDNNDDAITGYGTSPLTLQMAGNMKNLFGLNYLSAKIAYPGNSGVAVATLNAGNSVTFPAEIPSTGVFVYPEIAQPQFQTVEYDFWSPVRVWSDTGMHFIEDGLPGSQHFSPTNQSSQFFVSAGSSLQIASYAKLAVQNGYSGVYGYLGQYFDQAYKIDTNGNTTANQTGVLSPYGNFFATEPGPTALVTMPDLDTGERGTGIVHCVSLNVDKNHDGTMDLSFNGADATSQASPMEWWVNNGCSFSSGASDPFGHSVNNPYQQNYNNPTIPCVRDLENFARLWICGLPALTNGNYQISLSWANVGSGSPAINLVNALETNGEALYLTDTNIALRYASGSLGIGGTEGMKYPTIATNSPLTLPANLFTNAGNKYFLFEGAGIGSGELMLTISDSSSNVICQTGLWLDLHDVRDFYERAVIKDNTSGTKSSWTSSVEVVQPATASTLGDNTDLIVLVHGINVDNWHWLSQSDTVLKRLYWAGYHGKFATVDWPCNPINYQTFLTFDEDVFNNSELKAYKASTALKAYLSALRTRFPSCNLNILAHSQGNAVVSEAIAQGAPFDNYILTQGALPASCYDVNAPVDSTLAGREGYFQTPEWQPMGYHGVYTNLPGNIVNYYNPQDRVLGYWYTAQEFFKPSISYSYNGTNSVYTGIFSSYTITDSQESRANVSRSHTLSIGQQGLASGETKQGIMSATVDLHAQFGFNGTSDDEHSAQWTRPIQTSYLYYKQILLQILPTP